MIVRPRHDQFQVTITMDTATVAELANSGCLLDGFRAVQASDLAGRPLLWSQPPYSTTTTISWSDSHAAYTSQTPITDGTNVTVGFVLRLTSR
jgi:hypothetical protein